MPPKSAGERKCLRCHKATVGYYTLYCRPCGTHLRRVWGMRQAVPDPPGWSAHLEMLSILARLKIDLFPERRQRD